MVLKRKQPPPQPARPSAPQPPKPAPASPPVKAARAVFPEHALSTRSAWILVALVVVGAALIRVRLLDFPLERDEGEFAYIGQLLLDGVPPYREALTMKLPGTFAAYAAFEALFGQSAAGIHFGLLLVNSATILLVFLLGRRLYGNIAGVTAAAAFAVMTLNRGVLGFAAHATHFLTLCTVAGALLLLGACASGKRLIFFASGLLFGLAIVMKQHGACFALFGLLYLLGNDWQQRRGRGSDRELASTSAPPPSQPRASMLSHAITFSAGVVLPFAATCVILAALGVFDPFWFWTFTYAREYVAIPSLAAGLDDLEKQIGNIIGPDLWLWLFAGVGLLAVWWEKQHETVTRWQGDKVTTDANERSPCHPFTLSPCLFLTGYVVSGAAAVALGLYFRPHYFIMLLPALALLIGAGLAVINRAWVRQGFGGPIARTVPALAVLAALAWPLYDQQDLLFTYTPTEACWETYMENPFVEAPILAKYLREHTTPEDKIAVLGSEPELFFYSGRRSASRHIYMYPLMEPQPFALDMQKEMIQEIAAARPKFLVIVAVGGTWLGRPESHTLLLDWAKEYHHQHYVPIALIDIGRPWENRGLRDMGPTATRYYWSEEEAKQKPKSPFYIKVYQRKADAS